VPAASPDAEADSSGDGAAPSDATEQQVCDGISRLPLCYIGLSASSYIISARHARVSVVVEAPVRAYSCICKHMSGGQCEDHVM